MKNYYEILGVSESASADEIKIAYKNLAKKFHPDINKEKNAEAKFKEINEAYDTLKDSNKKSQYDMRRAGGFTGDFNFDGTNIPADIFEELFKNMRGHFHNAVNKSVLYHLEITLEEAFFGVKKKIIASHLAHKQTKEIEVNIPAGIQHGARIKLNGLGKQDHADIPPGDILIDITYKPDPVFETDGIQLARTLTIDPIEAMIGVEKTVETIDKKQLKIKIKPGTQPGTIQKIPNYGMSYAKNKRGNFLIHINVAIPAITDINTIQKLEEIKKLL